MVAKDSVEILKGNLQISKNDKLKTLTEQLSIISNNLEKNIEDNIKDMRTDVYPFTQDCYYDKYSLEQKQTMTSIKKMKQTKSTTFLENSKNHIR